MNFIFLLLFYTHNHYPVYIEYILCFSTVFSVMK